MASRKHFKVSGYIDFRDDGKFDAAISDENESPQAVSTGFSSYSLAESWILGAAQSRAQRHLQDNRNVTKS